MRIALISDTFLPQVNGVANVVANSAAELARRGHEVRVLTVSQGNRTYLQQVSGGKYEIHKLSSIPFWSYPDLRLTLPIGSAKRSLRGWKPEIIHVHTPFGAGYEAKRLAKLYQVPLIGTHHTFFDQYLRYVHIRSQRAAQLSWRYIVRYYGRCNLVLSPSESLLEELKAHGLVAPSQVLGNPVDTERFRPPNVKLSHKRLMYMGRLSYEKNLTTLLDAFALVLQQDPDVTLAIVGDGPERLGLRAHANRLKIGHAVTFCGMLQGEDLVHALQEATLFLTASLTENMPLSVLEAMASGLPVIAPAAKGLPGIIHDSVNGYLVAPNDPIEMAAATLKLLSEPGRAKKYAENARQTALHFSTQHVGARLEAAYYSVLDTY